MTKIRSALLGSIFLVFSHAAFAEAVTEPDMKVLIEQCRAGTQCTGASCVKLEATSADTSHIYGFSGVFNGNRLTCGAFLTPSYSFSVPSGMMVQFGVFFGTEQVACNNAASYTIDTNTKVSYSIGTNPNSCTVIYVP